MRIKVELSQEINSSVISDKLNHANNQKLKAEKFLKKSQVVNKILTEFDAEVLPDSVRLTNN